MESEVSVGTEGSDSGRTRRELLRRSLAGGATVGAVSALAGCDGDTPGTDTFTGTRTDTTRVRRSISSLQSSDPNGIIPAFRDAVRQMQGKPSGDPLNYENVAHIHGDAAFDCEHFNWQFLPWHRAYLFYFEDICRKLTGNDHFAIPYWNWAENPTVPSIFAKGAGSGSSNPLYVSDRRMQPGDTLPTPLFSKRKVERMLRDPNFFRFAGGFAFNCPRPRPPGCRSGSRRTGSGEGSGSGKNENPWHNDVHWRVGGERPNPGPLNTAAAPMDPIFWTHHSMVDCLWYEWNIERGHRNTSDSDWINSTALNGEFVDEDGNDVGDLGVLTTVLMPLAYNYEDRPKGAPTATFTPTPTTPQPTGTPTQGTETDDELEARLREGAEVALEMIDRFPLAEEVTVRVGEPVTVRTEAPAEDLVPYLSGQEPSRPLLVATGITPPSFPANFFTRVYVERPTATVDSTMDDPRFAGGFSFFVAEEGDMRGDASVDVAEPLRYLYDEGDLDLDRPVTFRLVPDPGRDGRGEVEGEWSADYLDLAISQSLVNGEIAEY